MLAVVTGATGLGGALIGALAMTQIERQRQSRRGEALRQAVLLDIERWKHVYESASEWRVVIAGSGMRWWDVSGEFSLHVPIGLHTAVSSLYVEREHVERAYADLCGNGIPKDQAYSAQFGFRRWTMMADEVIELWVRHYRTKGLAMAVRRVRRERLEVAGPHVRKEILSRVASRLRTEFSYRVDAAALISDLDRSESYREAMDTRLRSSAQDARCSDDESRQDRGAK